jgi:hypothetical protein
VTTNANHEPCARRSKLRKLVDRRKRSLRDHRRPEASFTREGCIITIKASSARARRWVAQNVYFEPWQRSKRGIACDQRAAADIYVAMQRDGITLEAVS